MLIILMAGSFAAAKETPVSLTLSAGNWRGEVYSSRRPSGDYNIPILSKDQTIGVRRVDRNVLEGILIAQGAPVFSERSFWSRDEEDDRVAAFDSWLSDNPAPKAGKKEVTDITEWVGHATQALTAILFPGEAQSAA